MFRRVRDFLRARPAAPETELNLKRLEGVIGRLAEEATRQDHQARLAKGGTQRARAVARGLRAELMRPARWRWWGAPSLPEMAPRVRRFAGR